MIAKLALLVFWISVCCAPASAQATGGDIAAAAQAKLNPLASSINVPATLSFGFDGGPENLEATLLNVRPRFPLPLTRNWRLVTRSDVSLVHASGSTEATGLSDIDVSVFVTPGKNGKWIWGAGPAAQLPTATSPMFGTDKWSLGPTGALVYVDGPWVNGVLVSHLWSMAGSTRSSDVSLTQVEVQISYTLANAWYVQTAPALSYDWQAPSERWVIPLGFEFGRAVTLANQPLNVEVGSYYSIWKPSGSPRWSFMLQAAWVH